MRRQAQRGTKEAPQKAHYITEEGKLYYVKCAEDTHGELHGAATWWTISDENQPVNLWLRCVYNHGELHGAWCEYYEDGVTLKEERNYRDNIVHGALATYDSDGSLYIECTFKNGLLDGYFKAWDDVTRGILLEKSLCKNDRPIYKHMYDASGHVTAEYYYNECGECVEEVTYLRKNGHCYVGRKSAKGYSEDIYV